MEHRNWNHDTILEALKQREKEGGSFGIVAMREDFGGLILAPTAIFGSYENALLAAKVGKSVTRSPRIKEDVFREWERAACRLAQGRYDLEKSASSTLSTGNTFRADTETIPNWRPCSESLPNGYSLRARVETGRKWGDRSLLLFEEIVERVTPGGGRPRLLHVGFYPVHGILKDFRGSPFVSSIEFK